MIYDLTGGMICDNMIYGMMWYMLWDMVRNKGYDMRHDVWYRRKEWSWQSWWFYHKIWSEYEYETEY